MAAALPFAMVGMSAASTMMSSNAQQLQGAALVQQAQRKQTEANFEADQLDIQAGQAQAVAQRGAENATLQSKLLNSTVIARAAASGAGASDPTVMSVVARNAQFGAYNRGVALYEGSESARVDRMKANALRYAGDIGIADAVTAQKVADQGATATALSGGVKTASLASKYFTSPNTTTTTNNPASFDAGSSGSFEDTSSSLA